MARVKKAQKGTTLGFEERMNQNIDKNISDQMNKLDQGLQTVEPKSVRKFKIGQREFDMDDNFLQNLSDDLYKNNIQGQSVTKIMDLIRSGGIEGIDDGGNFYGTDLGGAEKNTRANRAWNIGRSEIRDLQDTGRQMTGIIRSTYDRLNKPVTPEAPKTHNLSNRATDILSTYAYHGNAVPTGWNNMSIDERVRSYGTAIGGFQNKLGEFEGQKYDPKIHMNISEQAYNNLVANRANLLSDYNEMSKRWLADGIVDENEINEYRLKTGIDLGGQFGTKQLTAEEAQKAEADKKVEEEKLAKEKAEKEAKSIAFNPETGQYTLGGNPYSGDWTEQDGSKLLIEGGNPYTGLKETEEEYIPYYKGKAISYDAFKNIYSNPNLSQTEKDQLNALYASIGDARRGFINQDPNTDWEMRSQTGRAGVQGFNQYRFIDQDTALGDEYNTPAKHRIYEGISNIPSQYGVTPGKRVIVLETPQGKKQGFIRTVDNIKYLYPSDGSEPIRLGGDPSKRNKDWYYKEEEQSSKQNSSSNKNVITAEAYKNLSQEEKRKYSSTPRATDGKYVRISKEGGKILYAQQGTKLIYQEAPKESIYRGSNVDFDKINAYKKASLDRNNLRSQSATGREVFDKNVELSVADKADLTALGLDVAGLVAGFVPGVGNAAAGISGFGSTAAQFIADANRDGLDWGDFGNAAMGLGLDLTSAVPGLGQFSKGAKTLKALKKSSKVLGGLFATYGLVNGTQGLKNVLEKGQDATIDDWKMLAQGLQSVAMGTKQGMKYLGTKKANPKFGLKVGNQDVQFDTEDAAKAFAQKHKDFKTKSAELQKLTAENADQKLINQKAQETQSLVNELKTISGNNDFDGLADVKTKTSLNPFTFKGFGKKGDRNINPFGLKEGEAKVYQTSDREIRAAGDGNWAERLSASWLRKNNNLDGNLKDRGESNKEKLNQNKSDQKNKKLTPKDIERLKKEGEGKRNERAKNKQEYETYLKNQQRDRDLKLTSKKAAKEHSQLIENDKNKLANEMANGREKASNERKYLDGEYQRNKNEKIKKADNEKLGNEIAEGREKAKSERESKQSKYLTEKHDSKQKAKQKADVKEVNDAKREISSDKHKEAGKKSQETQNKKREEEKLQKIGKYLNEDNYLSDKRSETNAKKELEEAKDLLQEKINKLEDNKNKKPNLKRKDIRKATKGQDKSFNRTDSHDSKKSKDKAKDRKNYEKTKRSAEKKGVYLRKEGGVLYLQQGNRLSWGGGDNIETGANWKKLGNLATSVATPSNARFAATLIGNKKMMSELEKAKRPTNANPIYLDRIKNVGISQVQPQLSEINSSVNSTLPLYSDAKLNAATKLSQLSAANKMKSDVLGQLNLQNRQIDAQNQQIGQQETLQNAQITQQNAAKQDAFNQGLLTNKLGLIGSNVDAFSNKMLELERAKKLKQSRLDQINDQEFLLQQQANQKEAMDTFQKPWLEKAKLAGKDWSTYYSGLSKEESDNYLSEKTKAENKYLLDRTKAQKKYIQGSYFAKGGKMTIAEKKELEELKASKKRQLESDKAFNKLVLEKGKSHDKMLSLLSKDLKTSVKNILK